MQVYFFTKGDQNVASSRYRAYLVAETLNRKGYDVQVVPTTKRGCKAFLEYLKQLRTADRIYLQRTIYNKYFSVAVLIARLILRRQFVFDIDDAVYKHSFIKTVIFISLAKVVTCGSDQIRSWVKKYNRNNVLLLNGVPLSIYTVKDEESKDSLPLVIGWVGDGPAHYENLEMLPNIFEKLLEKEADFSVRIIGTCGDERIPKLFSHLPALPIEYIDSLNWADPREVVEEIKNFSIGVMPLVDSEWNKAKYFKVLEYMACGVPAVASDIATLRCVIDSGTNGYLADSIDAWVEDLTALLTDPALRRKTGADGRKTIERNHSLESMGERLIELIS